ncbi:serine hydrolase [Brucella abortus]|nr:serine hydrolase [Brucella abortus]
MASTSWVVFDADSGRMLGQDDASAQHAPASLAKMMTLYLTFEALKTGRLHWDRCAADFKNAASKVRMKLWLKAGDTISTRDAVNGMIIVSANDAATVMGEYLAGSEAAFARLMTQRARQIGMKSTIFANPSGLTANVSPVDDCTRHGGAGHGSFGEISRKNMRCFRSAPSLSRRVYNGHNNLMYRYAGVDGIKTGYKMYPAIICVVGLYQQQASGGRGSGRRLCRAARWPDGETSDALWRCR